MRALAVPVALAVLPAHAEGPQVDCTDPAAGAEEAVCQSEALVALDVELDRLYRAAANGPSMTDERPSELRTAQSDWIQDRDACRASDMGLKACLRAEYAIRIHDLRQGYGNARALAGASTGPFALVCDGAVHGLSAVFIDGPEPIVSLRWGDMRIALPQVPAASGAKYESGDWSGGTATFWTKGDEALFVPPGGTETSCRFDSTN